MSRNVWARESDRKSSAEEVVRAREMGVGMEMLMSMVIREVVPVRPSMDWKLLGEEIGHKKGKMCSHILSRWGL